jgi:hypothetical protein
MFENDKTDFFDALVEVRIFSPIPYFPINPMQCSYCKCTAQRRVACKRFSTRSNSSSSSFDLQFILAQNPSWSQG